MRTRSTNVAKAIHYLHAVNRWCLTGMIFCLLLSSLLYMLINLYYIIMLHYNYIKF